MKYYLGIDGGGTKTQLLLADDLGKKVDLVTVGPTSLVAVGEKQAVSNLKTGLDKVTQEINSSDQLSVETVVMGLASIDTEAEEKQAAELFQPIFSDYEVNQFTVISDSVIALVNATERENAIVLIAGTGSSCYGENQREEMTRVSGLDYLLTDQGSAYDIGLKVLKVAAKSYDGRSPKTELEQLVCEHFQVKQIPELKLKVYGPDLDKSQIARLAEVWSQALEAEDWAAQEIFEWETDELWLMIEAAVAQLGLADTKFDLVLEGSIAQLPPIITQIKQRIDRIDWSADIVLPHQPAVYGALKLALGDRYASI